MIRRALSILVAVVLSQPLFGRQLTPSEAFAGSVRNGVPVSGVRPMSQACGSSAVSVPELEYTLGNDGLNTVYVFRNSNGGFWVVAADDAVGNGLLGYTDSGEFDADSIPAGMRWWLEQYGSQIAAAAQSSAGVADASASAPVSRGGVSPLLDTKWGQSAPYNGKCPVYNGVQCPTGCVATAMAQVMNYYGYPSAGTGSKSYKASRINQTLSYDFASNPFDWDAIGSGDGEAVATLMYACGMSVEMNYSATVSGSNYMNASRALVGTFGYDKGMAFLNRSEYGEDEWLDLIHGELKAGRPVLYSGVSDTQGGHAFICDGCDDAGYFHINWGWKGCGDGYFRLDALDTTHKGKGFSNDEGAVIGIRPAMSDSEVRPVIRFNGPMSIVEGTVMRSSLNSVTVKCARAMFNQSVAASRLTFGVKLVGQDGQELYVAGGTTKNMSVGAALASYTVSSASLPAEGTWTVTPAVCTATGKWYDCSVPRNVEHAYVLTAASDGTLTFKSESETIADSHIDRDGVRVEELILPAKMTYTRGMDVTAIANNLSEVSCTKIYTPVLKLNGATVATGTEMTFDIEGGSEEAVEWHSYWQSRVDAGTYEVVILNRYGRQVSNAATIEVETPIAGIDEIEETPSASIDRTEAYDLEGRHVATYSGQAPDGLRGIYLLRHHLTDGSVKTEKTVLN